MDKVDCIVVGAGVVGLAVPRALSNAGREVIVVEEKTDIGTGISSRNSEVIHAGLYYPPKSLKGALCMRGKQLMYDYCLDMGVAHRRIGKLVVATSEDELPKLTQILSSTRKNGVTDLVLLPAEQAKEMEPSLSCVAALWSPSSGIVDSHGLMTALLGDVQANGALLAVASGMARAETKNGGWLIRTAGEAEFEIAANWLINCAGLKAPQIARQITGFPTTFIPSQRFVKGNYFLLGMRSPFDHLIYPLPAAGGLGIHLTLDLGGQAKFGPDVEWMPPNLAVEDLDYSVAPGRALPLYEAIRHFWSDLPDDALQPAYAGIRPRISSPSEPGSDFRIDGPTKHGFPGLINLFGIESPGLTASLAIGEYVSSILKGAGVEVALATR